MICREGQSFFSQGRRPASAWTAGHLAWARGDPFTVRKSVWGSLGCAYFKSAPMTLRDPVAYSATYWICRAHYAPQVTKSLSSHPRRRDVDMPAIRVYRKTHLRYCHSAPFAHAACMARGSRYPGPPARNYMHCLPSIMSTALTSCISIHHGHPSCRGKSSAACVRGWRDGLQHFTTHHRPRSPGASPVALSNG
jgi:hypothetical protein